MPISKIPYLPWLRVIGNKVIRNVVNAPIGAVMRNPLDPAALAGFSHAMFGRGIGADGLPDALRGLARTDVAAYKVKFADGIRPLVDSAIKQHKAKYGLNVATWTQEAQRSVYTIDLEPEAGGHQVAVVTLEPLTGPATAVLDPRLMRHFTGAFPGCFAALRDPDFLAVLNGGREIDATPTDVLASRWEDIKTYNANLLRDGTPMSGMHAIGWNSFIGVETHYSTTLRDFAYQSALMVTGPVHSQRGIVPYTAVAHPDFPGGLVCVSLHFGLNPIWGGDLVNSAIGPPLFKTLFRGGADLWEQRPNLLKRFGPDVANALLLDRTVERTVRGGWNLKDPTFARDRAVLSVLDAIGGEFLKELGMFAPGTLSTIESSHFCELRDIAAYEALVDAGVRRTQTDGYTGPGGLDKSEPGAVVPDLSSSLTGLLTPTPDSDPFNPTAPLGDPYDADAAAIRELGAELDPALVEQATRQDLEQRTRTALDEMPAPFTQNPAALVEAIADGSFRQGLQQTISATLLEGLAAKPEFAPLLERYGADGARSLAGLALGVPLFQRMTTIADGSDFLSSSVLRTVLQAKGHWLAESASDIQKRLADAVTHVTETTGELQAKQEALAAAQKLLDADPRNATLQEQRDAINRELLALTEQLEEAEQAETKAEDDAKANDAESAAAGEQAKEAAEYADAHRADIFQGGHDAVAP
jgi:hypothetical protein